MSTYSEHLERIYQRLQSIENRLCKGDTDDFLTTEEAMIALKVCKKTLQNWRDKGDIDFIKVGRKIYYNIKSIKSKTHGKH